MGGVRGIVQGWLWDEATVRGWWGSVCMGAWEVLVLETGMCEMCKMREKWESMNLKRWGIICWCLLSFEICFMLCALSSAHYFALLVAATTIHSRTPQMRCCYACSYHLVPEFTFLRDSAFRDKGLEFTERQNKANRTNASHPPTSDAPSLAPSSSQS